ncbi:MAG TPA: hypothetical protein VHM90_16260 [Phycisphaerae bacterium]|jgi:hypothetical protein|nr:hypothetical protein [Phycisphaerae bacterium]
MNLQPPQRDEFRRYAWDYFQFHASQRLSTFNFFVVLSVLLTSAAMTTFQEKFYLPCAGGFLGLMLAILSFVFWRMDQRNRQLLQNGTEALMHLDRTALYDQANPGEIHPLDLFRRDEANMRAQRGGILGPISYRSGMNAIFAIFGCIGLGLAVIGALMWYR